MKNYNAVYPKDALKQALNDETMNWTKYEKTALIRIVEDDLNKGNVFGDKVYWNAPGSRIVFRTERAETGYNVGLVL